MGEDPPEESHGGEPGPEAPAADRGGLAVSGDVQVRAGGGGVAGGVVNGDVHMASPRPPAATQG
ncbi:hypothetical protein [Actinacidiphila bryophytorum]|uniref:Uncharacterized protein n=1 Tax=Actinacidiphila bryophytorum TaxID=1436133 RepID=A0A9W4H3X8_9ACTN|nr:hypothetical protein [Actinacidiphila bryophytorum]MBM9439896.1 hypothetical protein [Actinacidiphila bryophytorum]MBN6544958.1 hypothetical protein [Actinacidiphila bryophytorum]CAG7648438.1 hypothetical protein SBRY_40931 [Actinacidiphila bryophytorum]